MRVNKVSLLFPPALFPDGGHLGYPVGLLLGEVHGFGAVLGQVVKGPGAPAFANDLVFALYDGVGPAVVEDVSMIAVDGFTPEDRDERKAFVGLGFLTV